MIEIPLLTIITKLLTIGVRLSGLMLFAPFFGSVVIPVRVKAILVIVLTLMLYPVVGQVNRSPRNYELANACHHRISRRSGYGDCDQHRV